MKRILFEFNEQLINALNIMEDSHKNIFITGRAGTGKSTLLNLFRDSTRKKVAVLAPTGVAALNVKGQTIHSFFGFKPGITPDQINQPRLKNKQSIYRKLDTIVIDEISMVRADLLDCVDKFLRLNGPQFEKPFGGIQMVFIGDLYQLPPVVINSEKEVFQSIYRTPYFYGARAFDSFDMEFVELEKVYRQQDEHFIALLNSIRNNSVTEENLELLNKRCQPEFEPSPDEFYVYLTTTNRLAEEINYRRLEELKGRLYTFSGHTMGDFGSEYLPTTVNLEVRIGAQVMMLNNDAEGRWVNGSVGIIKGITQNWNGQNIILARLFDGDEVEIAPFTWEISHFYVEVGKLRSEVVGTFTQYPLMLAWAVTIHKSQGKTFDRVIIDIGKGTFAHGQIYVALSRCTTFNGIILKKPVLRRHVWTNYQVMDFLNKYRNVKS